MRPGNGGGAPGQRPTRPAMSNRDDANGNNPCSRTPLTAVAFVAPAIGRRTLAALIVPRCPACGFLHQHRGNVGPRIGSCGASYTITVAGQRAGRSP